MKMLVVAVSRQVTALSAQLAMRNHIGWFRQVLYLVFLQIPLADKGELVTLFLSATINGSGICYCRVHTHMFHVHVHHRVLCSFLFWLKAQGSRLKPPGQDALIQ